MNMLQPVDREQTQDRILQAAVEIFAMEGFRDATVREICTKAGVNVASVNYYFRSKEALYSEALAFAFRQADRRYPMTEAVDADVSPEKCLKHFIEIFLHKLLDETCLGHHGKLIAREIADPTKALDGIIRTAIAPQFKVLRDLMPQLLGPGWSELDMQRCVLSVLGQCLMYKHSRSVIDRICPGVIADADEIERSAELIVQFSVAAFRGLATDLRGL